MPSSDAGRSRRALVHGILGAAGTWAIVGAISYWLTPFGLPDPWLLALFAAPWAVPFLWMSPLARKVGPLRVHYTVVFLSYVALSLVWTLGHRALTLLGMGSPPFLVGQAVLTVLALLSTLVMHRATLSQSAITPGPHQPDNRSLATSVRVAERALRDSHTPADPQVEQALSALKGLRGRLEFRISATTQLLTSPEYQTLSSEVEALSKQVRLGVLSADEILAQARQLTKGAEDIAHSERR